MENLQSDLQENFYPAEAFGEVVNEKATFPGQPEEDEPKPKKRPETEPGIQPEIEPDEDDDDDDDYDDPFTEPEIGDDPGEERKKQTIM